MLKKVVWSEQKNELLKQTRGVSFEDVMTAIHDGRELGRIKHNSAARMNQNISIVQINDCIYDVPFVENDEEIFFKTIYPNRKRKHYLH
jgi:uncharacterized DUF497 family protein